MCKGDARGNFYPICVFTIRKLFIFISIGKGRGALGLAG
jgi:hypothetical protein